MTKPLRGDGGRFAGSVGDGKTNIPTPSYSSPASPGYAEKAHSVSMAELHQEHLRQLAVTTDTEIADLYEKLFRFNSQIEQAVGGLHYELDHQRERVVGRGRFEREYPQTSSETISEARQVLEDPDAAEWKKRSVEKLLESYEATSLLKSEAKNRLRDLEAVYRRHYWTRAFLVHGGHVHSSMECSTCNRQGNDTQFVWLPQYSGSDETLIVDDAGERACTVCYPSAPISVLQRPTRIFSDEERQQLEEAEARRAQRDANRAARAAKAPTQSGEPLVLEVGETQNSRGELRMRKVELKTERTALTFATDIVAAQRSGSRWMAPYEVEPTHYAAVLEAITTSVAEKRGCSPADIISEITRKADAKIRKASS